MNSQYEDLYGILDVDPNATKDQIKAAYRKLAMQWHPDKNPNQREYAEIRFKKITDAYKVLIDDEERKKYDNNGSTSNRHTYVHRGMDDLYERFYGNNPNGATRPKPNIPKPAPRFAPSTPPPSSYNPKAWNAMRGPPPVQPNYNRSAFASATPSDVDDEEEDTLGSLIGDIVVKVPVTLEELFKGTKKTMRVARCREGTIENKSCTVTLYPGIASDTQILAAGQGNKSFGKEADNIIFKLVEQAHPRFKRDGDNIEEEIQLTMKEALLGTTINVTAIDGEHIISEIQGPIQPDQKQVFKGRGMFIPKTDRRGDYIITFKVVLPESLTDEQRKAIEELF